MNTLFMVLLVLHIAGGSIGLLTGTVNLLRRKGGKDHKRIGQVFTYSMLTAGFSSLVLAIMHPNYFLFIVGIFTLYLVGTGKRYIYLKLLGSSGRASGIDWTITVVMLLAGVLFIGLGIKFLIQTQTFGIVLLVFGFLGLRFARTDYNHYKGKVRAKNYWLLAHLQRMTGAYIAALTAFLVVNAKYFPEAVPLMLFWLLPTILLVPLIVKWSRRYEAKVEDLGDRI